MPNEGFLQTGAVSLEDGSWEQSGALQPCSARSGSDMCRTFIGSGGRTLALLEELGGDGEPQAAGAQDGQHDAGAQPRSHLQHTGRKSSAQSRSGLGLRQHSFICILQIPKHVMHSETSGNGTILHTWHESPSLTLRKEDELVRGVCDREQSTSLLSEKDAPPFIRLAHCVGVCVT